ncbi:MAG: DUF3309 domain-containing protein [Deltaproteobacteria bacterium]|nr:DUF3309 domain-containing protein [Deltaproteobacteria bacterium]
MGLFLIFALAALLLAAMPTWSYSRRWSYYPSGGITLALLVVVVLVLTGKIHI